MNQGNKNVVKSSKAKIIRFRNADTNYSEIFITRRRGVREGCNFVGDEARSTFVRITAIEVARETRTKFTHQ